MQAGDKQYDYRGYLADVPDRLVKCYNGLAAKEQKAAYCKGADYDARQQLAEHHIAHPEAKRGQVDAAGALEQVVVTTAAADGSKGTLRIEQLEHRTGVVREPADDREIEIHEPAQAHRIERIETRTANPILGDMLIETMFADYRAFDGVKFPTRIVQRQGGFPTLEVTVHEVRPNAAVALQPPAGGAPSPARAEGIKIGDGVWYLAGTPQPNSQLVEFRDYTVLIESSVTEARALANLAEARRLVTNKQGRYHVNSHHHGDHAAGLRALVSEGVTIVTHEMNRPFYEQTVLKNPHTLAPDALSRNPRQASFVWVADRHIIGDGARRLEIYHVPNGHTANLLMSYVPQEKLLIITDIFNDFGEPRPNDPPPGVVSPYYAALGDRVRQLKLDIERIAPSHGKGVVPAEMLWKALQGKVEAPAVRP